MKTGPLSVRCPHCDAEPGQRCMALCDWARQPHKARVKLAAAVQAHADPALDPYFAPLGPCGLCGSGLDQRHRVVDSIAGMLAAGEDPMTVAQDYGVPLEAVAVVMRWSHRWPEAQR